MSNANNAIVALTALQTFLTDVEAGNLLTGIPEIDAETRRLLATDTMPYVQAVLNGGSRAQQNAVQASRAAANNGAMPAVDALYTQFDLFMRAIAAQLNVLNNPTSVPRRTHPPLQ